LLEIQNTRIVFAVFSLEFKECVAGGKNEKAREKSKKDWVTWAVALPQSTFIA
jgi:hypothetical protein